MDAATIVERLNELGVKVSMEGRRLRFEPASRLPPDLVEAIKIHRQALVLAFGPPEILSRALKAKQEEVGVMRARQASEYYANDAEYQRWCRYQIDTLTAHMSEIQRYLKAGGTLRLPLCCKDESQTCLIAMRRFNCCLMRPDECGFSIRGLT